MRQTSRNLHDCKHMFQEMWELYDVTLYVIVFFEFYVVNFVDFVVDCYLHITLMYHKFLLVAHTLRNLHDCKLMFQEIWELYDVTLQVIVSFKFYVMNFVDFVIDCYSHITSHVSQAFASCTHYTSYSLLNLVHYIVCDFVVAIQD